MCGGGGAGGSGTQKYEWNDAMAQPWANMLSLGDKLRQRPYEQYGGQRIAGVNQDQESAMNQIRHYTNSPGEFLYGKGNEQFQDTLAGDYLTGGGANPFSTSNAYEGDSPTFRKMLNTGLSDIGENYKNATAVDTNASAVLNGVLGGGDHQRNVARNQEGLAKQMGNFTDQMLNKQYDRSAQLNEGYLNRGSQNYENERGRMMGAGQASQADQNLTLQRANALMGVGDINRGVTQDYLNQYYNDWQAGKGHEFQMADWYSGLLGRAQGGMSPNMTMTQPGYSASPFSTVLGAGLLGYGALKG